MTEEQDVVAETAAFAKRVSRDDRRSEEGAHVDHLGVALLMIERHSGDGCALRFEQIHGPVSHLTETAPAALGVVGAIEVVAADDAGPRAAGLARYGIAIRVVVGRAVRASRDLVVYDPAPDAIPRRGAVALRLGPSA